MNRDCLEAQTRRMALRIESYAQLSEIEQSDLQSTFMDELKRDLHELNAAILELPHEPDRNTLLDQIIQALEKIGMIATVVKVLVDVFR
jgi:hypothetical protein